MKKIALFIYALPLATMLGCQAMPYKPYAREVRRKPGVGGEISLKTEHRDEDRAKAQSMMDTNCGTMAPKISEEGEVVVGTTTNATASQTHNYGSNGTQVGSLFGIPVTSGAQQPSNDTATQATTTQVTEWVIKYDCAKTEVPVKATVDEAAPIKTLKKKKSKKATSGVSVSTDSVQ